MKKDTCEAQDLLHKDCEGIASHTVKVDGEKYRVCEECYEDLDTIRMAQWESYYRSVAR